MRGGHIRSNAIPAEIPLGSKRNERNRPMKKPTRKQPTKEAQSEIEFWKNRSINFEATLRTIRFIAVDADIKQLASEALDKSHDQ